MTYDYLVFLGRFQPFHKGHYSIVKRALELSKNLIMVLGSHESPLTFKNPLDTNQRISIIRSTLTTEEQKRVFFVSQHDHVYNDERWLSSIQSSVRTVIHNSGWTADPIKIGLIGFDKDHSSYYLKKFPFWDLVLIEKDEEILSATDLREEYYKNQRLSDKYFIDDVHRLTALNRLNIYKEKHTEEYNFIQNYKKKYGYGPFITADSVVTQSGYLLVIVRGGEYGKGRFALPGGFVNPTERVKDASVRELKEETNIDVPYPVLYGSVASEKYYDHPDRDDRGRIITFATHYKLQDREYLPKVKAGDDANQAYWISLDTFKKSRSNFFSDHYNIVEDILGV